MIEVMVAVVILLVLVSLASVGYQKYRDRTWMLVDETNEKILLAAVKLYAYDTHALPGSLSQLRGGDLERAYALVTGGKRPYTLFAFLQEQLGFLDIAEAQPLPSRYLGDNPQKILTCLADKTSEGISYGITTGGTDGAAEKPLSWLLDTNNAGKAVIVESDTKNPAPNGPFARRHEGERSFIKITAAGVIRKDTASGANPTEGEPP